LGLQACAQKTVKTPEAPAENMNPLINDVTTDPYSPPKYNKIAELPENKDRDMSYPQANIQIQLENYPDLAPRKLKYPPLQAFAR
jgi:hypothetical protein